MATYVLIHGGGHGGWCYSKVARQLRSSGHEVHAPSLSGLADRSHQLHAGIDLDTHVTDVANYLFYEDLHDVILVGHSYGGMVITGAAGRAPERIRTLVFLDAANPADGESLYDVARPMMEMARSTGQVINGIELVTIPAPGAAAFYGITDPQDQSWADERLSAQPWKCFEQKVHIADLAGYSAIPQYHVICTDTLPGRDPALIEAARAAGRLWILETGHDMMITEPDRTTEILQAVATDIA